MTFKNMLTPVIWNSTKGLLQGFEIQENLYSRLIESRISNLGYKIKENGYSKCMIYKKTFALRV